jgi:rRNA-processing protein FCF1
MQQILLDTNALIALSDPTDNLFRILEESLKAGSPCLELFGCLA